MKSDLDHTGFQKRLAELTSQEKVFYLFTPYNTSGTPFCGTFDDNTFNLTRNSHWGHIKAIEIKGEYRPGKHGSTIVDYSVGLPRFLRILSSVAFCLVFIATNTLLVVFADQIEYLTFFAANGLLGFVLLWLYVSTLVTKKIVTQRFKDEFEIDVEDEWEKLARSIVKN